MSLLTPKPSGGIISLYGEMTFHDGAPPLRELMSVLKALADESRVRALMALGPGELCVCQIV